MLLCCYTLYFAVAWNLGIMRAQRHAHASLLPLLPPAQAAGGLHGDLHGEWDPSALHLAPDGTLIFLPPLLPPYPALQLPPPHLWDNTARPNSDPQPLILSTPVTEGVEREVGNSPLPASTSVPTLPLANSQLSSGSIPPSQLAGPGPHPHLQPVGVQENCPSPPLRERSPVREEWVCSATPATAQPDIFSLRMQGVWGGRLEPRRIMQLG